MGGSSYTSDLLVDSIRRRGNLPSSASSAASDTSVYALLNEELQTYIVEMLLGIDEEYLVVTYDQSVVSGTANYSLPPRAIGRKLRRLLIQSGTSYYEQPRVEPTDENDGYSGYKWQGDQIVLVPTPTSVQTLRWEYFRRPAKVVATSAVATVSSINTGTKTITTSATIPSTFTTSATYDLVGATPGFRQLAIDQAVSVASGTTLTFSSTLPTDLAVGDYVCLADESPVPQIPVECHPVLAQRTYFKILEALGDEKVVVAKAVCDEMEKRMINLLTPRDEGSSRYVKNRWGPGFPNSFRRRF